MPPSSPNRALSGSYIAESDRIRTAFEASADGLDAAHARSALVDRIIGELYRLHIEPYGPGKLCLVALGGYGRQELFPFSDIDLLVVARTSSTLDKYRNPISDLVRSLWDLRIRTALTSRTLDECSVLSRDNLEFDVALVDLRCLAGDERLFDDLRNQKVPQLMGREGQILLRDLIEMTHARHSKFGNTIYHLEPHIKEGPGGLRDYHVARWLTIISELESRRQWSRLEKLWPARHATEGKLAIEFLSTARCFLHYHQGQDDNRLSYELQERAAASGIGVSARPRMQAADWMRIYFRHARSVQRITFEIIDGIQPARSGLYDLYRDWRSRVSNIDFSVVRGNVFLQAPASSQDVGYLMRLFEFVARHGLRLSQEAERSVEKAFASGEIKIKDYPDFGQHLCRTLALPHAAVSMRMMHRLGGLDVFFPEFQAIDSLVIRDFYHRYTVDEHSFLTIQNLHGLRHPEGEWDQKFSEILSELENPGLLAFALLFHDVGKGMACENHIEGSLAAVERIFARVSLNNDDRETIQFLIRNHLEMSTAFLRRDIFDPATVHRVAEIAGSHERLKMLCLLTYADIKSVNPEALTPWKAELLWRLYAATSNALTRNLDSERIHVGEAESLSRQTITRATLAGKDERGISEFLDGLPKRYLQTHAPEEIASHIQMAEKLRDNSAQTLLSNRRYYWELTVMTTDRPRLFATLTGTLAAWGMNIVAADAFSNKAGIILDTFRFVDTFHTLELNPTEQDRLRQTLVEVLAGVRSLEDLMRGRIRPHDPLRAKLRVLTRVHIDDDSSTHSTLLEIVTQDHPGLLYQISSLLSDFGCAIEVALIETQGQKAIDVFYLTSAGSKLDHAKKQAIEQALLAALQ